MKLPFILLLSFLFTISTKNQSFLKYHINFISVYQDDVESKISKEIATNLSEKKYEDVRKDFSNGLKNNLSTDMIAKGWENLVAQNGAFTEIISATKTNVQGYDVIKVRCKFEKENANVEVTFNDDKKVIGLFLKP